MRHKEDNYYIDRVLSGDKASFSALVDKHKDMVFNIALNILQNREDAEEIAQDSFLKAYQSLKSFRRESRFSTWLYRIVYNAAVSRKRKHNPERAPIDDFILESYTGDEVVATTGALDEEEQLTALNEALSMLAPEDRIIIDLFYREEHGVEDISEITAYSVSNVKVKLFRIRKKLYDEMKKSSVDRGK